MRRSILFGAATAILSVGLAGCGGSTTTTGGHDKAACEVCVTDGDCAAGLLCRDYGTAGGSALGNRCSTSGTGSSCTINDTPGLLPVDRR